MANEAFGKIIRDHFSWPITYNFSDLIVNVLPFEEYKAHEYFYPIFEFLRLLGFYQWEMVQQGIFVRGGITIGDIYTDEGVIFGPALVRAYELESQLARWPILSIDPVTFDEIKVAASEFLSFRTRANDNVVGAEMGVHQLGLLMRKTDDGTPFLDYLECLAYEDTTTGDLPFYFNDHKNRVLLAYEKYKHYKYEFVAQYHDEKCREHRCFSSVIGKLEGTPN
jgi:hypothetical protein